MNWGRGDLVRMVTLQVTGYIQLQVASFTSPHVPTLYMKIGRRILSLHACMHMIKTMVKLSPDNIKPLETHQAYRNFRGEKNQLSVKTVDISCFNCWHGGDN